LTPQDSKRRFSATPTLSTNVDDAAYAVHNCADPPSDSYEGHRRWNNLSVVSPSSDLLTVASSRRFSSTPDVLADLRGADCCQDEEDDRRQVIQQRRRDGSIRSLFPHLDSRPDDTPSPSGTSAAAAAVSSELSPSAAGVKVAVRIRPLVERELQTLASAMAGSNSTAVSVSSDNPKTLLVHQPSTANILSFCFDHCLDSTNPKSETYADQNCVYEKVGLPLLDKCLAGYNCCLFAYGMTSSGKTHTVMGAPGGDDRGLLPRFLQDLFQGKEIIEDQCEQLQVDISYYEIYNERIHDLLAASHDKSLRKVSLKVREHPTKGPFVEGLSVYSNVRTYADVMTWLALGNKQRATASTDVNQVSSRSHTVCTLGLKKLRIVDDENKQQQQQTATNTSSSASSVQLCISSRVNIVDLAGSERQSVAGTTGDRLREGSNINRSLLTLGKVISLLSERVANEAGVNSSAKKSNNQHIPYRESMLTWLLRDSLGGNSQTVMIATVSPAPQHIDETLSTLRYATKARSIVNLVRVNEDKSACMIRTLQAELERLRQKQLASSSGSEQSEAAVALAQDNARQALEISDLRDQLQACKLQAEELENWKLARLQAEAVKENCPAASSDTGSQTTPKVSATISTSPPVSAAVVNPAAPSTPLRHRQLSIVDGGCTASANLRRLSSTAAAGLSAVSANVSLANSSIGSFSPMLAPISPAAALEECLVGLQGSRVLLETCFNSVLAWTPADVMLAHLHSVLAALISAAEDDNAEQQQQQDDSLIASVSRTATDPLRCIRVAAAVQGLLHAFPLLVLLDNESELQQQQQQHQLEQSATDDQLNQQQHFSNNSSSNSQTLGDFLSTKWEPLRSLADRAVALLHAVRLGVEPLAKEAAAASIAICCRQLAPLIYAGGSGGVSTFLSWLAARQCPTDAVGTRLLASLRRAAGERLSQRCANLRRLLSLVRSELRVVALGCCGGDNVVGGLADVAEALDDFVGSVDCLLADAAGSAALVASREAEFDCACGDDADHAAAEERAGDGAAADADGSRLEQEGTPTAPRRRQRRRPQPERLSLPAFNQRINWINACPEFFKHSRAVVSHCQQTLRYLEILLGGSQLEIITVGVKCQHEMQRLDLDLDCLPVSKLFDSSIEPSRACLRRLKLTLEAACVKAAELVISGRNRHQRR
ncbi:hypothetical protein BOX15_Mlig032127g2, partial [Macrostomum lignano]